jgi:hypothetical protein
MTVSKVDRLEELLVLRATQPLSSAEHAELDALLETEVASDAEKFDRVAAAVHVAAIRTRHPLPAALRARLERQALSHLAGHKSDATD